MRATSTARVIRQLAFWLVWLLVPALPAFQAVAFEIEFERVYSGVNAGDGAADTTPGTSHHRMAYFFVHEAFSWGMVVT